MYLVTVSKINKYNDCKKYKNQFELFFIKVISALHVVLYFCTGRFMKPNWPYWEFFMLLGILYAGIVSLLL